MIGECVDREAPFGIMLIKEGPEVGGPAEPVRIGTTARITQVERLQEGRLNIMTTGERRFELVEVTQQLPYLTGQVRYLPEETGDAASPALAQVKEGYAVFLRHLTSLAGGWASTAELPEEPVALSFAVASSLATTVAMPGGVKQNILEAPDAAERLTRLVPLLEQGNEALAEEIAKRNPFKGPRLN
jgi:Lon protease-like protein